MLLRTAIAISALASLSLASQNELEGLLEETTEIATKTRVNADYVPGSVNIIRGEELKALGILNLNQPNALDMIVGMDSSVNALRGSGAVYGGQGVKIKWLINGKAISSQSWNNDRGGSGIISFPLSVDQIDRVEIIRGPDSAVYGDNAIFGVVNFVTKKSVNLASFSLGYQGDGKFSKNITTSVNGVKGDLEVSASLFLGQSDGYKMSLPTEGYFYNSFTGGHTPGNAPGDLPNGFGAGSALVGINYDGWKLDINRLQTSSAQGAFGNWYPTDMMPQSDKYVRDEIFTKIALKRDFRVGAVSVTPKVGFDQVEIDVKDFLMIDNRYVNNSSDDGTRAFSYKELRKHGEIDFEYKVGSHNINGGLFFQETKNPTDERYANYSYVGPWSADVWSITPNSYVGTAYAAENTARFQRAFFAQDSWDITNNATVTYGARYDSFGGDIKSNGWSPRVAIVYRVNKNHILKAQYAKAFRPPTFAETAGTGSNLDSEIVDTAEIGYIFKDEGFKFSSTLFESKIYDMIGIDDITYATINMSGVNRIRGAEFELKYSGQKFDVGLNQAFYDTKTESRGYNILSGDNTVNYYFNFKSSSFVLAPKVMTNLFLTINSDTDFPTTLWYHYVGAKKRKMEYDTNHPTYNGSLNKDVPAQDYLNITQQFKNISKNLDLSCGIQNLFGKTLKTLYKPLNQPNTGDIPYMGQMFWMNLSYKF